MLPIIEIDTLVKANRRATVTESRDVAIDLSGKVIEIYVKPLIDRNIARVGNYIQSGKNYH